MSYLKYVKHRSIWHRLFVGMMVIYSVLAARLEAQDGLPIDLIPNDAQLRLALAKQPRLAASEARLQSQRQEAILRRLGPYETVIAVGQQYRRPRNLAEGSSSDTMIGIERGLRLWGKESLDKAWADVIEARAQAEQALVVFEMHQQFFESWRGFLRELLAEESARRSAASSEALWLQAQARRRLGDLAQIDEQTAKAEQLQAFADLLEASAKKSAKIEQLSRRYPSLNYDRRLPTNFGQWLELLNNQFDLPRDVALAEQLLIERSPLVLAARLQAQAFGLQAKRADLDRRPDPTLGSYVSQERSGAERLIGVQLSIPIEGPQRAVSARLASQQTEEALNLTEELMLALQSDLRARLRSFHQGSEALKHRWEAYRLQDEAAARSLRGFSLGERTLAEVLQARRIADTQYVQALSQSLELFLLKTSLEIDLGMRWFAM